MVYQVQSKAPQQSVQMEYHYYKKNASTQFNSLFRHKCQADETIYKLILQCVNLLTDQLTGGMTAHVFNSWIYILLICDGISGLEEHLQ